MKVNKTGLITLRAKKVKTTSGPFKGLPATEFYQDGVLKGRISPSAAQPRKGQKTIVLNGWKFALKW